MKQIFTSESVTKGHPDKVSDQISDAILDELLKQDKLSRVAVETLVTENFVIISGEVTTKAIINYEEIIRKTIKNIGYTDPNLGFSYNTVDIIIKLKQQSSDIAQGVNASSGNTNELGAGDQGMMFGYANKETKTLMPKAIYIAHEIAKKLDAVKTNELKYLKPDGKVQVSINYENGLPGDINTIVISNQHEENITNEQIKDDLIKYVIDPEYINETTKILVNPTGKFVIGGPLGDTGLTGRKIIVDTYGGYAKHGGGAFSGKDATKVDRSAAYLARYIAKNIVANNLADKCEIGLAYAIGVANPVSIFVDTFNTSKYSNEELIDIIKNNFPLTPSQIIKQFDLQKPIYQQLATYGHMGREDLNVPWEQIITINI